MKKILIFILIISLLLIEGCSTVSYGVRKEIQKEDTLASEENELNSNNELTDQSEETNLLQNISFNAKQNPVVLVNFKDQQIEGLLMGMVSDSLLIQNVTISADTLNHLIAINEINHIRIIKKTRIGELTVYGLLIGAGTGLVIGFASGDDPPGWYSMTAGEKASVGALILGMVGGILGGLTGLGAGRDEEYDLSDQHYFQKVKLISELSGYEQ